MDKKNDIISELMNALDLIRREADKADASRHYIDGVAAFAMSKCDAQRTRNTDGYLVVKGGR
jgi:hypothetical protein